MNLGSVMWNLEHFYLIMASFTLNIRHRTIHFECSNGLAKRAVRTVKVMTLKKVTGSTTTEKPSQFLLNFRIPSSVVPGVSPKVAMLGRSLRSRFSRSCELDTWEHRKLLKKNYRGRSSLCAFIWSWVTMGYWQCFTSYGRNYDVATSLGNWTRHLEQLRLRQEGLSSEVPTPLDVPVLAAKRPESTHFQIEVFTSSSNPPVLSPDVSSSIIVIRSPSDPPVLSVG